MGKKSLYFLATLAFLSFGVYFFTSKKPVTQADSRYCPFCDPIIHFHYIPRKAGDNSIVKLIFKMFLVNMEKPISPAEMHEAVEKMKTAVNSKKFCIDNFKILISRIIE